VDTKDVNSIPLFGNYLANKKKFRNDLHILYMIGSPRELFKDKALNRKNDALVPAIVLVKKEGKEDLEFEEIAFNWHSIDLLQTYSFITPEGYIQSLKHKKKYENLFENERIDLSDNKVTKLTLENVIKKYGFYSKLSCAPSLLHRYKHELFLEFKSGQSTYIIPTIEVVRFFYCFSKSNSLKRAIFHPSGLNLLGKGVTKRSGNQYVVHLEASCNSDDYKKIFYFFYDDTLTNMFHEVYKDYISQRIINANFPFKNTLSMHCKTLRLPKNQNVALIVNILDSNMINNFLTDHDIDLYIDHPLSKSREEKTGKRDPTKDTRHKVPQKDPEKFDDSLSSQASIPEQMVINKDCTEYFSEEIKTGKMLKRGQRIERGGKVIYETEDIGEMSTQDTFLQGNSHAQKIVTSDQKDKIENYPKILPLNQYKDINHTADIVGYFMIKGYSILNQASFVFPDRLDGKKMAMSYLDKDKIIHRKYVLLILVKNSIHYIYMDVEAKETNKEILILINQSEDIAHKCIYQQVHYGNHKWLSKESLGLNDEVNFYRIRHRESESLVKAIDERNKSIAGY